MIRIDPATNTVRRDDSGRGRGLDSRLGRRGLGDHVDRGIVRIDPATNSVAATIKLASTTLGDPGRRRRPGVGAADSRERDRGRRPGDERRSRGPSRSAPGPFVVTRDRRRGVGAELEGHRHLAAQAASTRAASIARATASSTSAGTGCGPVRKRAGSRASARNDCACSAKPEIHHLDLVAGRRSQVEHLAAAEQPDAAVLGDVLRQLAAGAERVERRSPRSGRRSRAARRRVGARALGGRSRPSCRSR